VPGATSLSFAGDPLGVHQQTFHPIAVFFLIAGIVWLLGRKAGIRTNLAQEPALPGVENRLARAVKMDFPSEMAKSLVVRNLCH
jgi:hypothetical protein